jgi:hypothetical protein
MDSSFAEAPWKVTKNIAQTSKDFEGSIIFSFKAQSPAKNKNLNRNSIIIERDGRLIDNWIYESTTDQIMLFNEEIDARQTVEYEIYFQFEAPSDVIINIGVENVLFLAIVGLVMASFSIKPLFDESNKWWYRVIALVVFILGLSLIIWAVFLVV